MKFKFLTGNYESRITALIEEARKYERKNMQTWTMKFKSMT